MYKLFGSIKNIPIFDLSNQLNRQEMKAIINVNKKSAYADFNGRTYEVVEVLEKRISLNILGTTTDFTPKEVIIVDIDENLQKEYDSYNWGSKNCFKALEFYAFQNGILHKTPQYNCPA